MRNLPLSFLLVIAWGFALAQTEGGPQPATSFDYPSVQEALDTLKAKPGIQIQITKPDAWIIVSEPGDTQWSFTPNGHYAHPAVVKRAIKINPNGDVYIEMSSLCQSQKPSCDRLMEEFKALNERIRQSVKARLGKQ